MAARQTVVDSVDTDLGREKDDEGQENLTRSERRWLEAQSQAAAEEDAQDAQEQAARLAQARQILDDAGITYDLPTDQTGRTIRRPFAWARLLRPSADRPACGFCIVCAARGPVYSSLEAALTRDGSSLERYHDNCRCVAVPVYSSRSWPGKEDWERLADKYDEVAAWKVTDDTGSKVVEHRLQSAEIRTALDRWSRGDRSEEKSFVREARRIGAHPRLPVRQDTPIDTDGNPVEVLPSQIGEITVDTPGVDHIVETHGKGAAARQDRVRDVQPRRDRPGHPQHGPRPERDVGSVRRQVRRHVGTRWLPRPGEPSNRSPRPPSVDGVP